MPEGCPADNPALTVPSKQPRNSMQERSVEPLTAGRMTDYFVRAAIEERIHRPKNPGVKIEK
jgi:hypothetical protein